MKLRYTTQALTQLDEIGDYIRQDHPGAADLVFRRIRTTIESLAVFPLLGHSGHVEGTLEFVVPRLPYIVVYRLREDELHVLAVLHGARSR
jgi:toxin ParE1/3/4